MVWLCPGPCTAGCAALGQQKAAPGKGAAKIGREARGDSVVVHRDGAPSHFDLGAGHLAGVAEILVGVKFEGDGDGSRLIASLVNGHEAEEDVGMAAGAGLLGGATGEHGDDGYQRKGQKKRLFHKGKIDGM